MSFHTWTWGHLRTQNSRMYRLQSFNNIHSTSLVLNRLWWSRQNGSKTNKRTFVRSRINHFIQSLRWFPVRLVNVKQIGKNIPTKKCNGYAVWRKRECHGGVSEQWVLNWRNSKIAAQFPGRSQKSLQVSYCVNFKKRTEKFEEEDVRPIIENEDWIPSQKETLQTVIREEMNEMWKRVSTRMNKSIRGCQQKAKEWGLAIK